MERFEPKDRLHTWYEHWHRYHWIAPTLVGKSVADIACGTGYGSALMSQYASHVTGVDLSQKTIAAAQSTYDSTTNLTFVQASALATGLADDSFDVLVSFETLEHLTEHRQLCEEIIRLLKPGGVLVMSTPDKAVYSGDAQHNEFHLKELHAAEFQQLMADHFQHVLMFGQDLQTASCISPLPYQANRHPAELLYLQTGQEFEVAAKTSDATYVIAVASNDVDSLRPFQQASSLMNGVGNNLFVHQEQQVKNYLLSDAQLIEANQQNEQLRQQLKQQGQMISELQARLGL